MEKGINKNLDVNVKIRVKKVVNYDNYDSYAVYLNDEYVNYFDYPLNKDFSGLGVTREKMLKLIFRFETNEKLYKFFIEIYKEQKIQLEKRQLVEQTFNKYVKGEISWNEFVTEADEINDK